MAVCSLVRCTSAQPLAPCLLAVDLAHTALAGEVGGASVFRVWGSRAFVRDTSTDKLSSSAIPCVFLGFVPDALGWQFYHPTLRHVLPSQDVTFNESVPFYHLFPYRSTPPPPPPLFLTPGLPPVDPLLPQGPAPSGVPQVDPLPGPAPIQVDISSGAARGAASGGAEPGGAGSKGAETRGAEPAGVGTGGAEPGGAELECVEPGGAASEGAESGAAGAGGAGVAAGASAAGGAAATVPGGAHTRGTGAAGTGGVEGAGVVGPDAGGAVAAGARVRGTGVGGTGAVDPCAGGAGGASQPPLQPASSLPSPSPYTEQSDGLTERHEHASRPVSPVRTARRAPCSRPPPVPSTHTMALVLPFPSVSRLLATAVTYPSFESAAASALVAELLDLAAACRLDYATALIDESSSASPPSVGGECALGTDVLQDRQEDFECLAAAVPRFASMVLAPEGDPDAPNIPTPRSYIEAITGPYSSRWLAAMDAETAFWKSTGTYVDKVPPLGANIVDGMWIFRVKRPPGSPPAFKARYVARGFSTQWSLRRQVYGLCQASREWHDTLRTTLAALGFDLSTADPSLFLRTDTSLPPFYVLMYVDDIVFATGDTEALTLVKSELKKRHTCTDLGELHSYLGLQITRDRARRTITLTRLHMVHQVLQHFGFQFSSPQPTPLSTSHSL
ncbi:unnamed protein product [Closterium sp. NIES-54]